MTISSEPMINKLQGHLSEGKIILDSIEGFEQEKQNEYEFWQKKIETLRNEASNCVKQEITSESDKSEIQSLVDKISELNKEISSKLTS